MKRISLSLILVTIFTALMLPASAQSGGGKSKAPKSFSTDAFTTELLQFLNGNTKDDDKIKANTQVVDALEQVYTPMDEETRRQVVEMYNTLRTTKLSPMPDYVNATNALVAYRTATGVSPTLFGEWLGAMKGITEVTHKTKEIAAFVEYTLDLLNTHTLYHSRTSVWSVPAGARYSFVVTKHDVKTLFSDAINLTYASGTGKNADSNTIYGTTGAYLFIANDWEGHGGRITWERCGYGRDACYADLGYYSAVTKFPKFTADSVTFLNNQYFKSPIKGTLEEQLTTPMESTKYNFPKFRSYQKDFKLKDVMPGVDFEGSFMMYGSRFVTNDEKNPASMVMYRGGKRFLTISSTKFSILPHMLTSERATVKMYIGDDSICNTGILVRYTTKDNRVALTNDRKRNFYSPYTDSYHQLDIYCEAINWLIDKDIVEFRMVSQDGTRTFATFESNSFYSERKDREIQGIDQVSPVVRVYKYMKDNGMKHDFSLQSLVRHIGLDEGQTKLLIHGLAGSGLLSYDEGNNRIHVNNKLIGFYKAISKQKGHDYDALTLESDTKSINAELDLSSNDLRIHGIKKFVVSDSQIVIVKPYGGDATVKRNRDIVFSGFINVGRFEMNVTNATFIYNDFKLDLPQIDSLRFKVTDFTDTTKTRWVRTPLYSLVGNIQVDKPDNHCGLTKNKDYPIFNSEQPSYVYYDRPFIFNGIYARDRFYYSLRPFVIKQLTDFRTDSLEFGGVLTSAGIFPDIDEPLKVQRDYSLGFISKTPKEGLPAYGGKGTFAKKIDLSYRGLRGEGDLEYLTAHASTDKYLFFPDSMMAQTDTFYVREEQDYPDVHNGSTLLRWYPYRDSMTVSQLRGGTTFKMYHDVTQLAGRLILQPKGASAYGTCTLYEGTLKSKDFKLRSKEMEAQHTDFVLRSTKYDNIAFQAADMKSLVDYEEHTGTFTAPDSLQRVQLNAMNYAAWLDLYTWDWDHKLLVLDNSHETETQGVDALTLRERNQRLDRMPGAHFESTDPKLRDIRFSAIHSTYHYDAEELSARSVFALPVADALIAPGNDSLHISKGGMMSMIKGAQVLFPRDSAFHLFYGCDILVDNGQRYSGKGTIDYVSMDDKRQPIQMNAISSSDSGSVADGFVPDSARFTLSPAFGFAGKVRVDAQHTFYHFDGGVRLLHECAPIDQLGLLAYADYLDPEDIRVTVPEKPVDWKGHAINAAIRQGQDGLIPTSSFLTKQQKGNELLASYGLLHYDSEAQTYTITSEERLDDNEVIDRYLTLHTDNCVVEGEGPVTFGLCEGPASIYAYGNAYLNPSDIEEFKLNTVLGVNFPIDNGLVTQLATQIENDLRPMPADRDNELLDHALQFDLGGEAGHEAYMTYQATGAYDRMPKCFEGNTMLFENVKWQYSPQRGYYANCMTSLSHVGKKQLHVNVRLKAQYFKKSTENYLVLYIQLANDHWYYLKYEFKAQRLSISSSVGEWNDKLLSIKKDARTKDGFSYVLANSRVEINNFLGGFGDSGVGDADDEEEEEEEEE